MGEASKRITISPEDAAIVLHADGTFEIAIPVQEDDAPVHRHSLLVAAIATLIKGEDDHFWKPVKAQIAQIMASGKNLTIH